MSGLRYKAYGGFPVNNSDIFDNLGKFFKKNMEISDLNGKIAVKQKQVDVEKDQTKKYQLQRELQVLQLKKQIANFKK